ncbi:unnamed protein product [Phaeothamnion confervicola]
MEHRMSNGEVIVKECPFCHATQGKADNLWKLYIGLGSGGAWMCHRCGASGSWYDFKNKLGGLEISSTSDLIGHPPPRLPSAAAAFGGAASTVGALNASGLRLPPGCLPVPDQQRARGYAVNLMENPRWRHVRDYITDERRLRPEVLYKYGVGAGVFSFASDGGYVDAECVTFPWVARRQDTLPAQYKRALEAAAVASGYAQPSSSSGIGGGGGYGGRRPPLSVTAARAAAVSAAKTAAATATVSDARAAAPVAFGEDVGSVIVRIKARAWNRKEFQKLDPVGGGWGLFGFHTVPPGAREVVVTEGEYDAMAVYQETGKPAVSLPNGCRSLPVDVLPLLEDFERVYLWMDADGPGQEGAEKFTRKLGEKRCLVVRPLPGDKDPPKDANAALQQGRNLSAMLANARPLPHQDILRFEDVRSEVLHEIASPHEFSGTPVKSFPGLTNIIKGFRRGELTVFTGPTGAGKTTLLSQLSLDLSEAGVNTLWGSFEIKNTRLIKKMLQQFARRPLAEVIAGHPDALPSLADRFQTLPLHFMRFHGGTDVSLVLDAMEYAVYANDVEHIILDNLQFMLDRSGSGGGSGSGGRFDKFDLQDAALDKFRKFATERNVHVTLVIHPRKEDEGAKLTLSSVFGSAKATQEADLVVILQKGLNSKSLEVKKNRFDGQLGEVKLFFEVESGRLQESQF